MLALPCEQNSRVSGLRFAGGLLENVRSKLVFGRSDNNLVVSRNIGIEHSISQTAGLPHFDPVSLF